MIKLNHVTPREIYSPASEYWSIDNDIEVELTRFHGYALVGVTYLKRDIADQVYAQIKSMESFSGVQLDALSRYIIFIPLDKTDMLLKHIEQMDRTKIHKGFVF